MTELNNREELKLIYMYFCGRKKGGAVFILLNIYADPVCRQKGKRDEYDFLQQEIKRISE
jgi:hypothetical protein